MSPAEALAWIAGLHVLGMRFGLERMRAVLAALGHPERAQPALHVVGTNGKTSTTLLAAAALGSQGRRTGAYLSPHVTDWTERIQIDGAPVGEGEFASAAGEVREAAAALVRAGAHEPITQFEALTAMAFLAFARAEVDVAVIEAGLGGRYDATNVLGPDAVVILTNVALEHTDLLGDTEGSIAREKLAVCPDGSDRLVLGPLGARAERAVSAEMRRRRLRAHRVRRVARALPPALALPGAHQRDNLATALAGAERLLGTPLDPVPLAASIARVRVPGRLEIVAERPLMVLDGAHNPAGMDALASAIGEVVGGRRPIVAVVSLLGDKDAVGMMRALAGPAQLVVATASSHPRAAEPRRLAALARAAGVPAECAAHPGAALALARRAAGPEGAVLVCGSLYLLADVRHREVSAFQDSPAKVPDARGRLRSTG